MTKNIVPIAPITSGYPLPPPSGSALSSQDYRVFKKGVSIFTSAILSATGSYGLDIMRATVMGGAGGSRVSVLQHLKGLVSDYGYVGFLKQGLGPEIARVVIMRGLKWGLYPAVHQFRTGKPPEKGNTGSRVECSAFTAIIESCCISSMEVSKLALQKDQVNQFNNSVMKTIRTIKGHSGLMSLYTAFPSLVARQALWSSGYFASIEVFKDAQKQFVVKVWEGDSIPSGVQALLNFTAGFFAGVFGTVLNTPFDVVRTVDTVKVFEKGLPQKEPFSVALAGKSMRRTFGVAEQIVAKQGVLGLYRGWSIKAAHLGTSGAIMSVAIGFFNRILLGEK